MIILDTHTLIWLDEGSDRLGKKALSQIDQALQVSDTQVRLFGKPEVNGERRMGVVLARGETIEKAKDKAIAGSEAINYAL